MLKKLAVLKQIRAQCEKGTTYVEALNHISVDGVGRQISRSTLFKWRKRPLIDRYIARLAYLRDDENAEKVEGKLMWRIMNDKASPAELIFYLVNRRPDRWKNNYQIVHTGKEKNQIVVIRNTNILPSEKSQNEADLRADTLAI